MTKPPAQTYPSAGSFKIPLLKDGLHIALLPVADDLFDPIGRVAANWGSFEFQFDRVLAALLEADGRSAPDWQRSGFKRRKELFLDLSKSLFSDKPPVLSAFAKVCGSAANLHWRRNIVVHGAYAMTLQPGSHLATFRAEGVVKGRLVSINLDHATLEKLWHDIAHLSGSLKQAAEMVGEIQGFWPTLPDRELLQVYRETNHPWNPDPDKRTPQPESSSVPPEPPRPAGE